MGEGEEQGVVKIADFGLARIYQAPLKALADNGVSTVLFAVCSVRKISCSHVHTWNLSIYNVPI